MAVRKISGQTSLILGAGVKSRVPERRRDETPRSHRLIRTVLTCVLFLLLVSLPFGAFAKRSVKRTHCDTCTVQMKSGSGVWVRNPKRAFGRKATIDLFLAAVEAVQSAFSGTPDLMVGDISKNVFDSRHEAPKRRSATEGLYWILIGFITILLANVAIMVLIELIIHLL